MKTRQRTKSDYLNFTVFLSFASVLEIFAQHFCMLEVASARGFDRLEIHGLGSHMDFLESFGNYRLIQLEYARVHFLVYR